MKKTTIIAGSSIAIMLTAFLLRPRVVSQKKEVVVSYSTPKSYVHKEKEAYEYKSEENVIGTQVQIDSDVYGTSSATQAAEYLLPKDLQ